MEIAPEIVYIGLHHGSAQNAEILAPISPKKRVSMHGKPITRLTELVLYQVIYLLAS